MDFEDVLLEVGDRGRYQKKLILFFLLPCATLLPLITTNVLFMVSVPDHWCSVPEVVHSNLTIDQQKQLVRPSSEDLAKCYMHAINYTEYLALGNYTVPENTTSIRCRDGWEFDKTNYDVTAATQWNMYCEDDHYASFILTMYNVGSIIGTPIYGALSDKIGRKISFFITLTVCAASAIASVLMTNFTAFVILKTINGSLMPSVFQIPYIIVLELVAPEIRTHMNGLVNCSWTIGMCILPLLVYWTRNWVTLGLWTSIGSLIFLAYWKFLPESPRWLLSQERYSEAVVILKNMADENNKSVDADYLLKKLKALNEKYKSEENAKKSLEVSPTDLVRYPKIRKIFLISTVCWMACIMSYYGLTLNISNLAGNEFINFFLICIVEIPGYISSWFLMDRLGRRWCVTAFFLMTGIVCMLPAVVSGLPYADIICSMMGKYCASAAFMATYQQTSELYPTVLRSLGMGMCCTVAMTVSLAVPYLIYLGVYGRAIPFVVIGLASIMAGILASFFPETLNENLPQTILDAEEFAKNQKYFSWHRRKRSVSREKRNSTALTMKDVDNVQTKEDKDRDKLSPFLQNGD